MPLSQLPGSDLTVLIPDWELPTGVTALVTTRLGGVSEAGYASLNLGTHVGDNPTKVRRNRHRLRQTLPSDVTIQWLRQVHGTAVISPRHYQQANALSRLGVKTGDACVVNQLNLAAAVLTADCLPVLFASQDGQQVAAAHAGWRGLLSGVLEATLQSFSCSPATITCWLGPAIGPCHFEVGGEVRDAFLAYEKSLARDPAAMASTFQSVSHDKYLMDIYAAARLRLAYAGLNNISGGQRCTVCDDKHWFSYRRDGAVSGRMASLIFRQRP